MLFVNHSPSDSRGPLFNIISHRGQQGLEVFLIDNCMVFF